MSAGILSRFRTRHSPGYGKSQFAWERGMKYTLCCLNALIMLGGLTVIAVGTWTVVDKLSLESLLGTNLYISAAWILIGTGCAVICIALFGCFGAIRGVRCMLMTYFIILFCIFFILLLGGILGYVFRDQLDESMRQQMHDTMIRDYGFVDVVNDAWDALQQALRCCAVDDEYGLTNWRHSRWHEKEASPRPFLPATCCRTENDAILEGHPQNTVSFLTIQPCLGLAKHEVKEHAVILGSVGISIAGLLVLASQRYPSTCTSGEQDERKERKKRERQEMMTYKLEQELARCENPADNNEASTDPLTNWRHSRWHEKEASPRPFLPATCCRTENDAILEGHPQYVNLTACQARSGKPDDWPNPEYVYTQPCLGLAKHEVKEHAVILGSVGISIAGLLVLGMIFAMCLFREIE
ncbi:putative CD151 antigen [Hypsibius exemplaris]|uniref:CD151 antigen n=1 Tax=Hypsibius exemplaris TaxID=2072580 RepID=A0A1W0WRL9_HYPEX|nr:putative CD151 antigen [Hypsibius exemplaris]